MAKTHPIENGLLVSNDSWTFGLRPKPNYRYSPIIEYIEILLPFKHNVNFELSLVNSNVSKNYFKQKKTQIFFFLINQTSIVALGVKVNLIATVSPGSILLKLFNNRNGPPIFNKVLCNYMKFLEINSNQNPISLT